MSCNETRRGWMQILVACCLASTCGCGSGAQASPRTYAVSGSVVYNNAPVVGATVTFMSDSAPRQAVGVTDKEGKFQLSTFAVNDGAVAGEHKITVSKEEAAAETGIAGGAPPSEADRNPAKMIQVYQKSKEERKDSKPLVPAKYASMQSTPLKETVKADGTNQFVLQLAD